MSRNDIHVLSRAVILDEAHILLCKTLDLPHNFYFLPGGHVEQGESLKAALLLELLEETGAECQIKRFLGCLEYSFEPGHSSICHNHEYNFLFEVESSSLKRNLRLQKQEEHLELIWHPVNELSRIDFRAEPLKNLLFTWLNNPENHGFSSTMISKENK